MFRFILCLLSFCGLAAMAAGAENRNDFESTETAWSFAESDAAARLNLHERTLLTAHTGQGSEHFQLLASAGSYAYMTYPIEASRVIPELEPSLWIKSNRPGMQLMVRVVLPHSKAEGSEEPLTTLLHGESYSQTGTWQQLRMANLPELLERQLRVLRSRFGPQVNDREAFIDLVVLNAYGGQGKTDVWVDDLNVSGSVGREPIRLGPHDLAAPQFSGGEKLPQFERQSGKLLLAGRPHMLRAIEHNGEPFSWLKDLGFDVIVLAQPALRSQLQEAARFDLRLVCPPPPPDIGVTDEHDVVLAWILPEEFASSEETSRLRRSDPHQRPLCCLPSADLRSTSRIADVLLLAAAAPGGSFPLAELAPFLAEKTRLGRQGVPVWVGLQTQPPLALETQVRRLSRGDPPSLAIDPAQLRLQVLAAVAAGARGFLFRSHTALNTNDSTARLRTTAIKLINRELDLLEPWIAGGETAGNVETDAADVSAWSLQTERSRLLVLLRHAPDQQYVAQQLEPRPVSLVVHGVPLSGGAFQVTPGGLRPLACRRKSGGAGMTIDHMGLNSLVVITQDPLVIRFLNRELETVRDEMARLQTEATLIQYQRIAQQAQQLQRQQRGLASASTQLGAARGNLDQCEQLLVMKEFHNAHLLATRAAASLSLLQYAQWQQATRDFPSPQSSPLCAGSESLLAHWELVDRLRGANWSGNSLPGGEMESLERMRTSGWRHTRHENERVITEVELNTRAAKTGEHGLRIAAQPANQRSAPAVVETPPVWIDSAAVPVRTGDIVRVHGWVKVPQPLSGSREGFQIIDNVGGAALAQRIEAGNDWREFLFYRACGEETEFRLTFILTGLGEAWLDDVSVSTLSMQN